MKTKRREFIQSATALSGGLLLGGARISSGFASGGITSLIKIEEPFHGAVLNSRHGVEVDGGLKIEVQGEAPLDITVKVNGKIARRSGTKFISDVLLKERETLVTAESDGWFGENSHSVKVVWDKNSFPRYCFEIDDNVFFLRDLARKKYKSIFDCFYLKGLRDLNRKYGTKMVLNTYFSDGLEYTDEPEFTTQQLSDRYKQEWLDNSDWLRLTFHAYANKPDRPYQYASSEKLISDMDKVSSEIRRFAGDETYIPPSIIHWGMVQPSAYKPLADKGVKVLRGYFSKTASGGYDVNHNLDDIRSEYLSRHDALKDFGSGIVFGKVDMVINNTALDQIEPSLESIYEDDNRAEIMDLMTHEQYFWPFYAVYIPEHFERLDKAFRWVTEHGYKPVFMHEGFLGAPE
jgi:hypothetical protein